MSCRPYNGRRHERRMIAIEGLLAVLGLTCVASYILGATKTNAMKTLR